MEASRLSFQAGPPANEALTRRIDEIRGLLREPLVDEGADLSSAATLTELAGVLADRVERGHRQLIAASVQLSSLREVASRLLSVRSADRAAETIALYLHKAFDHERVAVLLHDRNEGSLRGVAVRRAGLGFFQAQAAIPLEGAEGALVDVFDGGEARLFASPGADAIHRGHADLAGAFDFENLGSLVIAPLRAAARPRPGTEAAPFHPLGLILVGRARDQHPLSVDDVGEIESIAATLATVVENGRLYQDLRKGEIFRDDLLNSMGSGLVALDLERRAISMNRTAGKLTGWALNDVLGSVPPFLPPGDRNVEAALRGARSGRPVLRKEITMTRRDGSRFAASLSTSPLRTEEGEIYGVITTFQDLTEFKKMEERILQLDRLAALGRFTAAIAHEIRNPLAGISAGVEYLNRGKKEGEVDDNVRFILNEIQRLNSIVEDLFRITHPRPLMTTPEAPEGILDRALRSLGHLPEEKGITVERKWGEKVPKVPVDADQIQQVAINLIKNAIEAMAPGGRLTMATAVRPGRPGEDGFVVLRVGDTGGGMSPEVKKRLFEPFFTRKASGTGLGLYICHGIVERHGGHLRVDSTEGAGSTFTVELPRTPVSNGGGA